MTQRRLKQIFFLIGLAFFIYLLRGAGWETLAQGFQRLGWFLLLLLALSALKYVVGALAWAATFVLLGFSPATGVMLALARRLRALSWSGVGLVFLLAHSVKPVPPQPEIGAQS